MKNEANARLMAIFQNKSHELNRFAASIFTSITITIYDSILLDFIRKRKEITIHAKGEKKNTEQQYSLLFDVWSIL